MGNYRPITDTWILARPKVAYHGAYPNGFLERAKRLLPCPLSMPVLHVCGGRVRDYPAWAKLCPNDVTVDLDPAVEPDLVWDVRAGVPRPKDFPQAMVRGLEEGPLTYGYGWWGILVDRPYTEEDAARYAPGPDKLPSASALVRASMEVLIPGGRVGLLDYVFPRPPRTGVKLVACIGVVAGYDNRKRCFSVFEKEGA